MIRSIIAKYPRVSLLKIVSCTIELRYLSDAVVFQNSILGLSNLLQLFQCNRCVECLGNTLLRCDLNNSSVSSFYHKLLSISNAERVLQKPLSLCLKISRVLLPFQVVALCAMLRMEPLSKPHHRSRYAGVRALLQDRISWPYRTTFSPANGEDLPAAQILMHS